MIITTPELLWNSNYLASYSDISNCPSADSSQSYAGKWVMDPEKAAYRGV